MPASSLPTLGFQDKVGHGLTYCLLTIWFCGVYPRRRGPVIALGLFGLGLAMEGLQAMTRSRTPEFYDVIANSTGILVGLALARAGLDNWCVKVEKFLVPGRLRD